MAPTSKAAKSAAFPTSSDPTSLSSTNAPAPAAATGLTLADGRPGRGAVIPANRPAIETQFNGTADPNSVHVYVDSLDVTSSTSRSPSGFLYSPQSDLQAMQHTVRVTGKDTSGASFDRSWRFTSGTTSTTNFIRGVRPANNATIGSSFTVSGTTLPNSIVVIQAGVTNNPTTLGGAIGAILGVGGGGAPARGQLTANPDGTFSTSVNLNVQSGATVQLVVNSTAPSGAAAPPVNRTLQVR